VGEQQQKKKDCHDDVESSLQRAAAISAARLAP
jgi:hypothetical protein